MDLGRTLYQFFRKRYEPVLDKGVIFRLETGPGSRTLPGRNVVMGTFLCRACSEYGPEYELRADGEPLETFTASDQEEALRVGLVLTQKFLDKLIDIPY